MVFCRYEKVGTAVYTPHLDLLRGVTMACRRAELDIKFSEGFNPHARVYFVQPLPIGTMSECEYMTIDTDEDPKKLMELLNASLQPGIKILSSGKVEQNPNVAKLMYKADYEIVFEKSVDLGDFKKIMDSKSYEVTFTQKGKEKTKDVREMIFALSGKGSVYNFTLACGNGNLRADRLINQMLRGSKDSDVCYKVIRKQLYTKDGINIDKLFF